MGVIYKNGVAYGGDNAEMTGASSTVNGAAGLVPAPSAGDQEKFLRGDGTWSIPEGKYLVQSGTATTNDTTSGGIAYITFPNSFKKILGITAISNKEGIVCSTAGFDNTKATIRTYSVKDSTSISATVKWFAIGEV